MVLLSKVGRVGQIANLSYVMKTSKKEKEGKKHNEQGGQVTISRMNSGLVTEVMAQAAAENEQILSAVLH